MSKRVIICIMGLIYSYFSGAVLANSSIRVSSDSNSFSLFLTDISNHKPFLEIRRLPKAPNLQVTIPPRANDLRRFPFFLSVDSNLNGKSDLEFSPKGLSFLEKGLVGFQVNSSSPATAKFEMPYFDRIELQIHDSLQKDSHLQVHGYKIDLIVIRRIDDGNLQITVRNKFFRTEKDRVFETLFRW